MRIAATFTVVAGLLSAAVSAEVLTLAEEKGDPVLAGEGQHVVVLWSESGWIVTYRTSSNGGVTFAPARRFPDPMAVADVASDSDSVHVCLRNYADVRYPAFFYSRIDPSTGTASTPIRLSSGPAQVRNCHVVASGRRVAIVWEEEVSPVKRNLLVVQSNDLGRAFTAPRSIATLGGYSGFPSVAMGGSVMVSWLDESSKTTWLVRAEAGLSPPLRLFDDHASVTAVGAAGNDVVVVAGDRIRMSYDGGRSFAPTVSIVTPSVFGSPPLLNVPRVVCKGKSIYIVSPANSNRGMYFAQSSDAGRSFSGAIPLAKMYEAFVWDPHIFTAPAQLIVTWAEDANRETSMVHRVSNDDGRTFGPAVHTPMNLFEDGRVTPAAVLANQNALFYAWHEPKLRGAGFIRFLRIPLR